MRIDFYKTRRGRSPVAEFIQEQPAPLQAAIARAFDRIEEHGLRGSGVSLRQLRGKLWEIRVQAGAAARVFYVLRTEVELVVLHAYRKQSQKAPAREIDIAESRMKEVLE